MLIHVYMKDKFIDMYMVLEMWSSYTKKQILFKLPLSCNNQIRNNFCCSQDED